MLRHPWATGSTLAASGLGAVPLPVLGAAALELFLLATHAKVLLALGRSLEYAELKGRRAYFVVDLATPWAAVAAGMFYQLLPGPPPPALLLLLCLHALLHASYIATWNSSAHTDRVIRLSSVDAKRRRGCGAYGSAELAWFYAGTLFDIACHAAVLARLLASVM